MVKLHRGLTVRERAPQALAGIDLAKEAAEKTRFLDTLREEWFKQAEEKGLFDPATREGMVRKTSY